MALNQKEILLGMESVLDELIFLATELCSQTEQALIEEAIKDSQAKQKKLIEELYLLDSQVKEHYNDPKFYPDIVSSIQRKLFTFQKLNDTFFENINSSEKGLIHFELSLKPLNPDI